MRSVLHRHERRATAPVEPLPRFAALDDDVRRLLDEIDDVLGSVRPTPALHVDDRDDCFVLDVELPRVRRDDVTVEVVGRTVVVSGGRHHRRGLLRRRTRETDRFRVETALPAEVDRDAVTATLRRGVLTVVVPKAASARRRRVPVRVR